MTCLQETVPAIWDCKNICFNLSPAVHNLPPVYTGFLKCRSTFARLMVNPTSFPLLTSFRWLQLCLALNVKYSTFKYLLWFINAHELPPSGNVCSTKTLSAMQLMHEISLLYPQTLKFYPWNYQFTYHFTLENTNGWSNI